VLVGRSPEPAHEAPKTAGLDHAGLRRHFLDAARASGAPVRPAGIERQVARHLAVREMRQNLDDLARLGAQVDYRVVDVTDEAEMAALLDDLYARYGRIDLVVHGAGLIEDALLEAKTADSFDRVFDTKVDSAYLLARLLRPETLKGLCFFTSVAGRYGNRGQTDYAAANETLNRFAWALRRRWGPQVAVKAINWGPWGPTTSGAGMVTEAVARQFASRGINLVEARAGADLFFKEMFWSPATQVESVGWSADGETMEAAACRLPPRRGEEQLEAEGLVLLRHARRAEGEGSVLLWRFDLVNAPYVDHHRFGGNPVMPMAAAMQMMSEVPRAFGLPRPVIALEDLQMFKGFTLESGPFDIRIELGGEAPDGRRRVSLWDVRDPHRLCYRAELRFADAVPQGPRRAIAQAGAPWMGPRLPQIYRQWLSHGPRFQTLTDLRELSPGHVLTEAVATRPADFVPLTEGLGWNFDPGLIDGALQAVWIWSRAIQGASALPLGSTAVRRFDGDPSKGPLAGVAKEPYKYHYLQSGQAAVPADSMGNWWNGSYVTNTGNLKLDLVHNFFLELGARATKMRVYEMASEPTARELTAFLLVRGSTHVIAFAKALEKLSGVEVSKLFPIPELSTHQFPECRKYIEQGLYHTMYRFSPEDYRRFGEIWNGPHPDGAPDLVVSDDPIPTLAPPPEATAEPQLASPVAPTMEPGFIKEVATRLFGSSLSS
jgi:Mn-containing catalase/NAD(P)-dependent dehydrogenase (short-subunit alcohol dehydrogenase family)